MTLTNIIVLIISALGILFTYWFFLRKNSKAKEVSGSVAITVEGGYNPEVISIPQGISTTLTFTRTNSNSCLEDVVIPDFKIKKYLPMNKAVSIEITPSQKGEYEISCGMNMFHGKIIVK